MATLDYKIKVSWSQQSDQWRWTVATSATGVIADGYHSNKELASADAEDAAKKHARNYELHQGREYVYKPFLGEY